MAFISKRKLLPAHVPTHWWKHRGKILLIAVLTLVLIVLITVVVQFFRAKAAAQGYNERAQTYVTTVATDWKKHGEVLAASTTREQVSGELKKLNASLTEANEPKKPDIWIGTLNKEYKEVDANATKLHEARSALQAELEWQQKFVEYNYQLNTLLTSAITPTVKPTEMAAQEAKWQTLAAELQKIIAPPELQDVHKQLQTASLAIAETSKELAVTFEKKDTAAYDKAKTALQGHFVALHTTGEALEKLANDHAKLLEQRYKDFIAARP